MLLPYLTMATPVSEVESMLHVQFVSSFTPSWRYAQDSAVPVLTSQSDNHVLQLAWGLRLKKKKATPSLWVQAEGIIKQRATRVSIRIRRCLAIANCFFIKSFPSDILIYNPREKFMLLAGIW